MLCCKVSDLYIYMYNLQKTEALSSLTASTQQSRPSFELKVSCPIQLSSTPRKLSQLNCILQRKTDEASVLQKRLHHFALESGSGRDKAQAYASSLTPGGSKPRTPGGYRTPSKGQRSPGLSTPHRRAGTPAGVMSGVTPTGGRTQQRQLAEVQVSK